MRWATYTLIPTSELPRGLSHSLGSQEIAAHLVNESEVFSRVSGIESGTFCIPYLDSELKMLLGLVEPVRGDIELSKGVVAQGSGDGVFSDVLEFEIEGFKILGLGSVVLAALHELKTFVVVFYRF